MFLHVQILFILRVQDADFDLENDSVLSLKLKKNMGQVIEFSSKDIMCKRRHFNAISY